MLSVSKRTRVNAARQTMFNHSGTKDLYKNSRIIDTAISNNPVFLRIKGYKSLSLNLSLIFALTQKTSSSLSRVQRVKDKYLPFAFFCL
jgi:hypothetical protein